MRLIRATYADPLQHALKKMPQPNQTHLALAYIPNPKSSKAGPHMPRHTGVRVTLLLKYPGRVGDDEGDSSCVYCCSFA